MNDTKCVSKRKKFNNIKNGMYVYILNLSLANIMVSLVLHKIRHNIPDPWHRSFATYTHTQTYTYINLYKMNI